MGDLSLECFPIVLAKHYESGSSGTLEVEAESSRRKVYLRGGQVVFAASDDRNDRLGELLVRRGELRIQDYLEASAFVQPGKRFGTVLVERGVFTGEKLVWAVKEQVKEILFSLFDLVSGAYSFRAGGEAGEEVITLSLNTPELIRQGVSRMDHAVRVLDAFRDPGCRLALLRPPEEVISDFSLEEPDKELIRSLKQARAVTDLLAGEAQWAQFGLLKFLWCLTVLGWAQVLPPEKASSPSGEDLDLEVTGEDLGLIP